MPPGQQRGHRQCGRHLGRDGQAEQDPAEHGPAGGAGRGQHQDRGRGDAHRDHVHVGAVAGLQDHRRAPGPQRGHPDVPAQPAQAEQQQHRDEDGDQRRGGLDGQARVAGGGQVVHPEEVRLGDRRVDGRHGRPVDLRAARGEFGGRMTADVRRRDAVLGVGVEEELVPQPGQLRGRGDVLVRVDARGLDFPVPDVAVEIVAAPRRRGHRDRLQGDAAEQDERDRGPPRHLPQQPGGGDERDPGADQQRQPAEPRRVEAGPDEQQDQGRRHRQGEADPGYP